MPLIILGIIVLVGAGLMIYYQIGPSFRNRFNAAKDTSSPEYSKDKENYGRFIELERLSVVGSDDEDDDDDDDDESENYDDDYDDDDDDDNERLTYGKSSDGKVLYIFDAGKTELRPLTEEDDEDDEEDEEKDEEEEGE